MSRLEPPLSKPFDLHSATVAATQSGAPLGAVLHFSWPRTTRALGRRATASAALLALSTVARAATPASWPRFLNLSRVPVMPALKLSAAWFHQRPSVPKNPCGSGGADAGFAASWAAAKPTLSTIAPANRAPSAGPHARLFGKNVKALLPMPVKLTPGQPCRVAA